jgi:ribose-phosphate pyrophosphokinase
VNYFKVRMKTPMVIAPDAGSLGMAKEAADILDCDFDHMKKKRISGEEVIIEVKSLDVKNKDVLILDDIISTGDTIIKVADFVREWKPRSINVGCIHPLFTKGIEMFTGKVERLVASNTIESAVSKVNVGPIIARELKSLL